MRISNPPNFAVLYGVLGSSSYIAAWCNQSAQLLGTSFLCVGIFRFDFLSEGDEGLGVQFLSNILADSNTREFSPNERPLFPKTPFHLLSNIFRCRYDGDDTIQLSLSYNRLSIISCANKQKP